jgi:3-oxoacyl-[acyl-carrier-protein] synthase III
MKKNKLTKGQRQKQGKKNKKKNSKDVSRAPEAKKRWDKKMENKQYQVGKMQVEMMKQIYDKMLKKDEKNS